MSPWLSYYEEYVSVILSIYPHDWQIMKYVFLFLLLTTDQIFNYSHETTGCNNCSDSKGINNTSSRIWQTLMTGVQNYQQLGEVEIEWSTLTIAILAIS